MKYMKIGTLLEIMDDTGGIEIIPCPPELGGTHKIWNRVEHREAVSRALAVWQAHPETRESYVATCDILRSHHLPVLGYHTWRHILEEYGDADVEEVTAIIDEAAQAAADHGYEALFDRFQVARGMIGHVEYSSNSLPPIPVIRYHLFQ